MSYLLKDRNGNLILRPITHPATDEQVHDQLRRMSDAGELVLPSATIEPRVAQLEFDVYGDPDTPIPSLSWKIGSTNDDTGETTSDPQGMRVVSQKIHAVSPLIIHFSNTSKWKYAAYRFDPDGRYAGCDSSWQSVPNIEIERGWSVLVKVRENNYKVFDDSLIAEMSATITVQSNRHAGALRAIESISDIPERMTGVETSVRQNTSRISALRNSIANMKGGETTLLLQYSDNAFPSIEYGEIYWNDGQDIGTSTIYARSTGYLQVLEDDVVFVANAPDTTIVSYYVYDKVGDKYVFDRASPWYNRGGSFAATKGKYFRVLFYDTNGVDLNLCKVIRSASVLSQIISGIVSQDNSGNLFNETLSQTQKVEMEETAAAIRTAMTKPSAAIIAWFTDLHLECASTTTTSGTNINRTKQHFTMYNKMLSDGIPVDLMLLGGDYLQNSPQTAKAPAMHGLGMLGEFLTKVNHKAPIAVIKGNHDDNTMHVDYRDGYVDDLTRWDLVQSHDRDSTLRDVDHMEKSYGYYDIPNRKIRVFYLNTVDVPTKLDTDSNTIQYPGQGETGFSEAQLRFVVDHLHFDEEGWQVIFFSHHCFLKNSFPSPMNNTGMAPTHGGTVIQDILQGFMRREKGVIENTTADFVYTIEYDFTANKSDTIIACVNGHTHYDGEAFLDGINWIATRAIDGHATYHFTDTSVYIIIDRATRMITLVANGDGPDRYIPY